MMYIKNVELIIEPRSQMVEVISNVIVKRKDTNQYNFGGTKEEMFGYIARRYLGESLNIKRVIFNPPATIVFWEDGTKTVVKAQGKEKFDKEKGLAMAIVKKVLGNKGNYNNLFKEWCK